MFAYYELVILRTATKRLDPDIVITTEDLQRAGVPLSTHDIRLVCEIMNAEGLFSTYSEALDETVDFVLSFKGKYYKQVWHATLKAFLLESIATPIVVSVLTTFITLSITGLL